MTKHDDKPKLPLLRAIHAGDRYSRRVQGGNVQAEAPCDGVLIETAEEDIFFPRGEVAYALHVLDGQRPVFPARKRAARKW